jgi:hypothetical protein
MWPLAYPYTRAFTLLLMHVESRLRRLCVCCRLLRLIALAFVPPRQAPAPRPADNVVLDRTPTPLVSARPRPSVDIIVSEDNHRPKRQISALLEHLDEAKALRWRFSKA